MLSKELFVELYDKHYDELYAFCRRRVDGAVVDDVVSEVFTVLWKRSGKLEPGLERAWIFGIARNVIRNQWRSQRRERRLVGRVAGAWDSEPTPPETIVVRRLSDRAVLDALARLRTADREILMLSVWDDLSGPEIAATLGLSVNAANVRLHRAKGRLAKLVNRSMPDDIGDIAPGEGLA